MQTKREISSGGVIFKKENNKIFVALISRHKETRKKRRIEIWCLPKGKIEKNETPLDTALREVQEETGLKGKVLDKIGSINYWYISKQQEAKFFKTVCFFLLQFLSGDTSLHDFEVAKVEWVQVENALNRLTYKSERNILSKARSLILKKR